MNTTMQGSEMFAQMTGRAVEAFSMFAEANQKIMRDLVDLSASTAKEGVRLYAELSSSAVEALKEGQSCLLRRQANCRRCRVIRSACTRRVCWSPWKARRRPSRCSRPTRRR
jgi:hypothetical protein